MKQCRVSGIVLDVRECLDETGVNSSEFIGGIDGSDMDTIIKSKICDAIRYVYEHADISKLEPSVMSVAEYDVTDDYVGRVKLPNDFLRLCSVSMEGWSRSVSELIRHDDTRYAMLKNPITSGYPDNPKVALLENSNGRYLEIYRGTNKDDIPTVLYMQEPSVGSQYAIPDKVYRGVVYYTAGLTLLTFKDSHADALINQSLTMIGG